MRRLSRVLNLLVSLALLVPLSISAQVTPNIVIHEVQVEGKDASGKSVANDDFIELRNISRSAISIVKWKLQKRTSSGSVNTIKVFDETCLSLPPNASLIWGNKAGAFAMIADYTTAQSIAKTNVIELLDESGKVHDSLIWGSDGLPGKSLERNSNTLAWSISESPSPSGGGGSCPEPQPEDVPSSPAPIKTPAPVRINELFPDPKGSDEMGEFIELYNTGATVTSLSEFTLRDASKSGVYVLPPGTVITPHGYLTISNAKSRLSLNNSNETVSLSDPTGNLIDSVSYGTAKEDASYGYDGSTFRWSLFLTPGEPNRFGDAPSPKKTTVPKKTYKNVPATFSVSGSDDQTYQWDFGDGTTSRKREVAHAYEETGTYSGTLTVREGVEETVQAFNVEVGTFPDRKISITALSPNPEGGDPSSEWISLTNKAKKKIDLLGWSIATGSNKKKLSNHPIRESFVLKPGEERALTRDVAAFSLPNEKGTVELRRPDGKTSVKTSYAKEGGVKENEVWRKKNGGGWEWTSEKPPESKRKTSVKKPVEDETENAESAMLTLPTPEIPRMITLDDLSPQDRLRLESEAEAKARQKIFAELVDRNTVSHAEEGSVLGVSDTREGGYSGMMFRTLNQALSEILSRE